MSKSREPIPRTAEDMARNALNTSKKAHIALGAMISQLESRSSNVGDLKGFFELVQKVDQEWLNKEAKVRSEKIERISVDWDSDVNRTVEANRRFGLRCLKELYGAYIDG